MKKVVSILDIDRIKLDVYAFALINNEDVDSYYNIYLGDLFLGEG